MGHGLKADSSEWGMAQNPLSKGWLCKHVASSVDFELPEEEAVATVRFQALPGLVPRNDYFVRVIWTLCQDAEPPSPVLASGIKAEMR
jgi:hypothetical protein